MKNFLPTNKSEMKYRGWDELDFILVSGDAYVDHPSFGTAIISRYLESRGYRVGILPQPRWQDSRDFTKLGRPSLAFLVTAGNLDSMVNHYTVAKRKRQKDEYSPGGKIGFRPDRATIIYSQKIRETYGDIPIILGGIEASLRRLAHYDYWENRVRPSLLVDSGADLIIYGMGERAIGEVADALQGGLNIKDIIYVNGTVFKTSNLQQAYQPIVLPSYQEVKISKKKFAESFFIQYQNNDSFQGKTLVEPTNNLFIVQNPPAIPLSQKEIDEIYSFPYMRNYHPYYENLGGVPAIKEVRFSITSHRGCFGGCNFCSLSFHQGRVIQSRSQESILKEIEELIHLPDFKGYIHDVGGPTANFYHLACLKQVERGPCSKRQCLFPHPCHNLNANHSDFLELLRKIRQIPEVRKVFIRSGIRYDYLLADQNDDFFEELCIYHVSGQLKVAPEHVSNEVLEKMGKPGKEVYTQFVKKYFEINKKHHLKHYLVPYYMSSHPGSNLKAAIELAEYVRDMGYNPEQVQDFYPTPGTLSTVMYYTELDPRNLKKVYVPKSPHEKAMQRALIQYRRPENYSLVREALLKAGRSDLIGYGKKCLIHQRENE
ncbi:MAG: YgiQ family radical SAM protein [Candidatus Atribacteria bacterium]|nr:YgiQ family radical SAM protein [Candidatus Atribacteria bacterium]